MRNMDRDAIEADYVSVIYWATRKARLQLLGELPGPKPGAAAYELLERARRRGGPVLRDLPPA